MHISEGILSTQMLAAGWAVAGVGVAVGLKKLDTDKIARVAFFSSAFFLASLVNVRIGPSSTHLSLIAPLGLVLGWSAFPAVMIALLLQALLLQFGGLLVLGANTVNIALPALIVYLLFGSHIRSSDGKVASVLGFLSGFLAVVLCAVGVAFFLGMTDANFMGIAGVIFAAHLPLAVVEGLITMFLVAFLKRISPDILMGVER
ncbi:MAG: cobalt transporter CbiM [Fretibacterium sp.]|nr:cobalt transporter CbiM [Fretibacterium sp.]